MTDMIERAAKAIFLTHHEATLIGWDDLSEQAKEEFMAQGRAAIKAVHAYLKAGDFWYDECQECAVSRVIERELAPHPKS